eukprot:5148023-Prymnesium_polylepis.1
MRRSRPSSNGLSNRCGSSSKAFASAEWAACKSPVLRPTVHERVGALVGLAGPCTSSRSSSPSVQGAGQLCRAASWSAEL